MRFRKYNVWPFGLSAAARVVAVGSLVASAALQAQHLSGSGKIARAWDILIAETIPRSQADPALVVSQPALPRSSSDAFRNSFFLNSRSEFIHSSSAYTGLPTVTGVIEAPVTGSPVPDGVPFPSVFQPKSHHAYSLVNFGTRGFGSERINTSFSLRYRQDITHVDDGSPSLSVINTFDSNRRVELVSGHVEIDGFLQRSLPRSRTNLRVGRQYVYGAELASLDGTSFSMGRGPVSLMLFGGRRFTYYSDPQQRAMGGANLSIRLPHASTIEFQSFFYCRGSHVVGFHKRINKHWSLKTRFKAIGGNPVDLGGQLTFLPPGGKTSLRFGYFQKLSDHDFFFDYALDARDDDSFNRRARLLLGPIQPYGQVTVTGRREIVRRLSFGSSLVLRRLTSAVDDEGPFATSFWDWRINAQAYPWRYLEVVVEGHHRSSDRQSASQGVGLGNLRHSGETRFQDLSIEMRRSFIGERLVATVGGFYRRLDMENQFVTIERVRAAGFLAGGFVNVNPKTALFVHYSLDDDFYLFRPSIENSRIVRLGLQWRY